MTRGSWQGAIWDAIVGTGEYQVQSKFRVRL